MAVVRQVWQFSLDDARAALHGLRSLGDVLDESVGARVETIRARESCRSLLVLARLDPDDDETWSEILHPSADDFGFEQAVAARLVLVLAGLSQLLDEGGVDLEGEGVGFSPRDGYVSPRYLEAAIREGMPEWDVETLLRGRGLPTLLREEELIPDDLVDQCEPWLAGGWMSAEAAREWAQQPITESGRLDRAIIETANQVAERTRLDDEALVAALRGGMTNLIATYSNASGITWIIQD